jgi:hypothetical protein
VIEACDQKRGDAPDKTSLTEAKVAVREDTVGGAR